MSILETSFDELWAAHCHRVEAVARGLLKHDSRTLSDDHRDLVSAGRVALWRASTTYDEKRCPGGSFWTYAQSRVRWAMLDELRTWDHVARNGRKKTVEPWYLMQSKSLTAAQGVAVPDDPECNAVLDEKKDLLLSTLPQLDTREQYVIRRLLLDQATATEVARELDITPSRVAQLKNRAVARLRRKLTEQT